jgi:rhodanese-related sulfurtransferase
LADPITVEALLRAARGALIRLTPDEALSRADRGDLLVDIRPLEQRRADGRIPGARIVPRNVLEWRLDPRSEHNDPDLARTDCAVILICNEGYQSSLAAATIRTFGVDATDVIGGAKGWIDSGLPTEPEPGG